MYQQQQGYYSQPYRDEENYDSSYGYNYRNYRSPVQDSSIKGKIEQKYWRGKQKVIEKLGKDQDEFVIAGDAEVDSRLEAFQHIKMTCMQLMAATECYQNKIFALSQDENEMGRFLRDQGATDKTKAGKMMIAVGKAQSYAAQQRLGYKHWDLEKPADFIVNFEHISHSFLVLLLILNRLVLRSPLVRLFAEVETFRFRAIQDTQITVDKMEQARSDYRARLLWMADISKELDPDHNKRLDKYRDVQFQVKAAKKLFDKLKGDVIQKIDLLSASRCNLLSATLEPYQTSMVKFLSTTAKSYNAVYEQYKGHPSYQFQILKHILPNNGIIDDDDENNEDEDSEGKKIKSKKSRTKRSKSLETAEDISENISKENEDDDDKLISFDSSPNEEDKPPVSENGTKGTANMADLLGGLSSDEASPGFGDYTSDQAQNDAEKGFEDILGKFEENNILAESSKAPNDSFSLLGEIDDNSPNPQTVPSQLAPSVDDLLFGSPVQAQQAQDEKKSDLDILSDVLSNQSLSATDSNSFSGQWNSLFGQESQTKEALGDLQITGDSLEVTNSNQMFMPSFLMEQMRKADPMALNEGPPKDFSCIKDSSKIEKTPPQGRKKKADNKKGGTGKDMSAWFNLFADLDPLSNPDAVGATSKTIEEKQAC